jgi:hypothetical protein
LYFQIRDAQLSTSFSWIFYSFKQSIFSHQIFD